MGNILIGEIVTSATTVRPGESLRVEVKNPQGQALDESSGVETRINGLRGPVQFLQFLKAGKRPIAVECWNGQAHERESIDIVVEGEPVMFISSSAASKELAILHVQPSLTNPYVVTFRLGDKHNFKMAPSSGGKSRVGSPTEVWDSSFMKVFNNKREGAVGSAMALTLAGGSSEARGLMPTRSRSTRLYWSIEILRAILTSSRAREPAVGI